jgi:hypothetical protein
MKTVAARILLLLFVYTVLFSLYGHTLPKASALVSNSTENERELAVDSSDTSSFVEDILTPMLAVIGVIVGAFLTHFTTVLKERPIIRRMRDYIRTELREYRWFFGDYLSQLDKNPLDNPSIIISIKEKDDIILRLKNFSVSYFESMTTDRKLQIFEARSLFKLEKAYTTFREYVTFLLKDIEKEKVAIKIERKRRDQTLALIDEALESLL